MYRRLYVFMDVLICTVFFALFMLSYECDYIQYESSINEYIKFHDSNFTL